MLRIAGYVALILAPLLVLFAIVLAIGMALFGLAIFRSDVFGLFAIAFVAFALATSVTAGIWLARAAKAPPRQEPPSA
jgi:hypothetical protein